MKHQSYKLGMTGSVLINGFTQRLTRLASAGRFDEVFGAKCHQFRMNAPLTQAELEAFELAHNVRLPADYRQFLSTVGNGGAGPYYGIHQLGTGDDDKPWGKDDWLIGDLSALFPHSNKWNPVPLDADGVVVDDDTLLDEIEEEYWALKHVNGAIPICQQGCNLRFWLVVTGSEAGHIWEDKRVDWGGLIPVRSLNASRCSFATWYADWLSMAEQACGVCSTLGTPIQTCLSLDIAWAGSPCHDCA